MATMKKLLAVLALVQLLSSLHVHGISASADMPRETSDVGSCHITGYLPGKSGICNPTHGSVCCVNGRRYLQYKCSPPVLAESSAILTINSFVKGGDGGGPSFCDNRFHQDSELVVVLSMGWILLDASVN